MPEQRTDESKAAYIRAYQTVGAIVQRPSASVQPVSEIPMKQVPNPYA